MPATSVPASLADRLTRWQSLWGRKADTRGSRSFAAALATGVDLFRDVYAFAVDGAKSGTSARGMDRDLQVRELLAAWLKPTPAIERRLVATDPAVRSDPGTLAYVKAVVRARTVLAFPAGSTAGRSRGRRAADAAEVGVSQEEFRDAIKARLAVGP